MHEPLDPACSHCCHFVYCFAGESPLAEWGYCALDQKNGGPPPSLLQELEGLARSGDYPRLYALAQGLYEETDDGCAAYEHR